MSKATTAKISASINGDNVSPEGLLFEIDVNSFPMVSANVAETSGKVSVKTPIAPEVIARIGKLQTARLAGRTTPDFEVFAEDGIGGSVNYSGFISSPILELTKVSTSEKLATVGQAALLDAMDLSIYGTGLYAAQTPGAPRVESGPLLKPVPAARNGDAPGTILAITDLLVSNYAATIASIQHRAMERQQIVRQHSINTNGPLRMWRQMLTDSDVKFQSWEAAFKAHGEIAKHLSKSVHDVLIALMPGFWNKVRALMSSFQMYYVPSFAGFGHFERVDKKVADTTDVMEVSVSGFSVSDGSARILQPGGVVMYAMAPEWARKEKGGRTPSAVAFAPDPLLQGFIQHEAVPFWLLRGGGVPIFGSEMDGKKDPGAKVNLSLAQRAKAAVAAAAQKNKVDAASSRVMTEMCELMFKELQLAHSSVGMTIPLDFNLTKYLGKRVILRIRGADDEKPGAKKTEFTAFVQGFTHSVDLRAGKQMNSFTQVRLSHAKFS
jgi:hypothetical protein